MDATYEYGSLLRHAARYGNEDVAYHLIDMKVDINLAVNGKTPLMIALERKNDRVASVLLNAGAEIDITTDHEVNVYLRRIVHLPNLKCDTIKAIITRLQSQTFTKDLLLDRLIQVNCPLFIAASLRDVQVIRVMLTRGFDVNSQDSKGRTALHAAAIYDDVELAEFLIDNGVDIKILDAKRQDALHFAVYWENPNVVELLLRRGADPNGNPLGVTILHWASLKKHNEKNHKITEILLQYGADPQILLLGTTILAIAEDQSIGRTNLILAHLAMLEAQGTLIREPKIRSVINSNLRFKEYYESCRRILKTKINKSIKVIDLLSKSDNEMKIYLRNEKFVSKLNFINHNKQEVANLYPYYFNTIYKRVSTISRAMRLKYSVTAVIVKLTKYIVPDIVMEKILGYLDEQSQEQLCQLELATHYRRNRKLSSE